MKLISHCCLAEIDCRNNDGDYCMECNENCDAIEEPTDKEFYSWLAERDYLKKEEGYYDHQEKALKEITKNLIKYCDPKPEYSGMRASDLANKILKSGWLTPKEREEKTRERLNNFKYPDYIDPKRVMDSFDNMINNLKN